MREQILLNSNDLYVIAQIGVGDRGQNTFAKTYCALAAETSGSAQGEKIVCQVSGVVRLAVNEGVSLMVWPNSSDVNTSPEYTYFGAFLVSN